MECEGEWAKGRVQLARRKQSPTSVVLSRERERERETESSRARDNITAFVYLLSFFLVRCELCLPEVCSANVPVTTAQTGAVVDCIVKAAHFWV